ncbi:MAG: hypothetical protein SVW57_11600, partial [Thermodesulfobacteriota bacterium]|nr:hypothetical protein [Thermodesulfobacteriota bacterium]
FSLLCQILETPLAVKNKEEARSFFNRLRQAFFDYNGSREDSIEFYEYEKRIRDILSNFAKEPTETETALLRKALVESDMDSHVMRSKRMHAAEKATLRMHREEDEEDIQ